MKNISHILLSRLSFNQQSSDSKDETRDNSDLSATQKRAKSVSFPFTKQVKQKNLSAPKVNIKSWTRVDKRQSLQVPLFSAPLPDTVSSPPPETTSVHRARFPSIATNDLTRVPSAFTPIALQPSTPAPAETIKTSSSKDTFVNKSTRSLFFQIVYGDRSVSSSTLAISVTQPDEETESFFTIPPEAPPLPIAASFVRQPRPPSPSPHKHHLKHPSENSLRARSASTGSQDLKPSTSFSSYQDGIKFSWRHSIRSQESDGLFFTSLQSRPPVIPRQKMRSTSLVENTSSKSTASMDIGHLSKSLSRTNITRKKSSHSVKETNFVSETSFASRDVLQEMKDKFSLESVEGTINQYAIVKDIGEGSFSKVLLVFNTDDERYYACKTISKKRLRKKTLWSNGPQRKSRLIQGSNDMTSELSSLDILPKVDYMEAVRQEIAILKRLSKHSHISTLVEVLEDAKCDILYMVFELCEFGSIMKLKLGHVVPCFTEDLARRYFRGIVLGLEYRMNPSQTYSVVHRDLKPDNILLNANNQAVIGDFSISICTEELMKHPKDETPQRERPQSATSRNTGNCMLTPMFTPPEILSNSTAPYTPASDIWSLGITLFCFVHGRIPFDETNIDILYKEITNNAIEVSADLSQALKDLFAQMFLKSPEERISLKDIKRHSWLTRNGKEPLPTTEENLLDSTNITQDELDNAVKPAITLFDKLWRRRRSKR